MSNLISGKEALFALVNGEEVLYISEAHKNKPDSSWGDAKEVEDFSSDAWCFKLKHRTITLNGIEVPAPFEPKDGEACWHINPRHERGYHFDDELGLFSQFGCWRTELEIKQVVEALRSIFK